MEFRKVTMNLTERDVRNTEEICKRLHSRSKAQAVSSALSITEGLTREVQNGSEVMIRRPDGSTRTMVIAGL